LRKAGVSSVYKNLTDDSPVSVVLRPLNHHLLSKDEVCKMLPGAIPERLTPLGSINAGEANLVLRPVCVQDRHGIAVGQTDYFAIQLRRCSHCGRHACGCRRQNDGEHDADETGSRNEGARAGHRRTSTL
jgi:hypothetical protein